MCWLELPTGEHKDAFLGEVEPIDEKILHALGVVDAPLQVVPRPLVRHPADHGPLPRVGRRGQAPRRSTARGGRGRAVTEAVGSGGGARRRERGHVGDGAADGAEDGSGVGRELEGGAAVGAVYQDQHRPHLPGAG